jgi:hypothetical protein
MGEARDQDEDYDSLATDLAKDGFSTPSTQRILVEKVHQLLRLWMYCMQEGVIHSASLVRLDYSTASVEKHRLCLLINLLCTVRRTTVSRIFIFQRRESLLQYHLDSDFFYTPINNYILNTKTATIKDGKFTCHWSNGRRSRRFCRI